MITDERLRELIAHKLTINGIPVITESVLQAKLFTAMQSIEGAGASIELTEAVVQVGKAKDMALEVELERQALALELQAEHTKTDGLAGALREARELIGHVKTHGSHDIAPERLVSTLALIQQVMPL